MTDITYQTATGGIASPSALLSRIAAWCTHFVEGVREGQEIAARYHALAQLSTPELARHGFNRRMIARAALTGYWGISPGILVENLAPYALWAGFSMVTAPHSTDLLSDLPERLADLLLANAKPVKLAADEILFFAGDPGDGCYRLDEGLVKVSMASPKGAERILAILGPGSIVGDMAMVDGRTRSASVSALRDCKLRFISRASFEAVALKNPEVYKHLLNLVATRLRDTDQVVAAGSFLPVKGRVARALLDLAKAFGNDVGGGRVVIRQKLSQSDVAAMAGIARENVSRILNEWMRSKIVTRLSGYYCLENKAKLEREIKL